MVGEAVGDDFQTRRVSIVGNIGREGGRKSHPLYNKRWANVI
jgi:hypothetical protein